MCSLTGILNNAPMRKSIERETVVYGLTPIEADDGISPIIRHDDLICPFCRTKSFVPISMEVNTNVMSYPNLFSNGQRVYSDVDRFYQHDEPITIKCRVCGIEISRLKQTEIYFYPQEPKNNEDGNNKSEKQENLG